MQKPKRRGRPPLTEAQKRQRARERERVRTGGASDLIEQHPSIDPPADAPHSYPSPLHAPPVLRSEGQRMLLHVEGSLHAIAIEVDARSPQSVADWRSGKRRPSLESRARMQAAFGIPIEAWASAPRLDGSSGVNGHTDQPTADADRPAAPAVYADPNAPIPSSLDSCLSLLAQIQADRAKLANLLPAERVKLADAEARILKLRAELERAAEFSEDRYVRDHPAWLKVRREIARVLGAFPDAARAVADALERMEM